MTRETNPLSLCMIVKNEASVLPRCLKSVRSLVSEVILVDTGSTDGTRDIGREFGAQTFLYEWVDDFAAARNFSLDQATGSWILVLDADEVLVYNNEKDFGKLLADPDAEGYFVRVVNLLGSPPDLETSEDLVVRLFRNKPLYRFAGHIHEQVRPAIAGAAGEKSLKRAPLTIYHDGYLSEVIRKKNKTLRNSRVIGKALAHSPKNPFLLYSLGCEEFVSEAYEKALETFSQARSVISDTEGYLPDLIIKMGLCQYKLGLREEMQSLISQYQKLSPLSPELLFLSGLSNLEAGRLVEADQAIKECLARLPADRAQPMAIKPHQIFQALGEIHEARGLLSEAVQFYFLALKNKPAYLYPLLCMIRLIRQTPDVPFDPYLSFASPEIKAALLEKLIWLPNADAVIFLMVSLAADVVSSDPGVAALLVQRLDPVLVKKKPEPADFRVQTARELLQALLCLTGQPSINTDSSRDRCLKLVENLKELLYLDDRDTKASAPGREKNGIHKDIDWQPSPAETRRPQSVSQRTEPPGPGGSGS